MFSGVVPCEIYNYNRLQYVVVELFCCQTFVYKNNVYFQKNPFMTPVRLTDDHSPLVRNGIADWLYERTSEIRLIIIIIIVTITIIVVVVNGVVG